MINKSKKQKASILVVTMMILGIVLVTALSVSVVSIQQRKASMGSNKSNQAYQVADTGIEKVMDAIVKNRTLSVSDLVGGSFGFSCVTNSNNHAVLKKAGETYEVELKKTTDAETTDCTSATPLSEIASIKSIGTNSGQQRAIEAAVAASGGYQMSCLHTLYSGTNEYVCCRIDTSNGVTNCKIATPGTSSTWVDLGTSNPWTTSGSSSPYSISCFDMSNTSGCCRMDGSNNTECKYYGHGTSTWAIFANNPSW